MGQSVIMHVATVSAIAIALISFPSPVTQQVDSNFRKTYAGIWGSPQGRIIAILTHSDGQFRLNDIECVVGDMHQAPNGELFGAWRGGKQLVLQGYAAKGSTIANQYVTTLLTSPFEGEIRLRNLSTSSGTGPVAFSLKLRSSKTSLHVDDIDEIYSYIGNFKKVHFGGHFSDAHYTLFMQPSIDGVKYVGRLSYNGQSWTVRGNRTGIRLGFGISEDSHGSSVGEGYLEWTPSPAVVAQLLGGANVSADQIYVAMTLPKLLSNGHKGFLQRSN